ncbi:MAG: hypothetical protein OXE96_07690 [Gemmatimonadetes bacterium]|nr:hypothetical protein [Gemmatimonadota bacterium]
MFRHSTMFPLRGKVRRPGKPGLRRSLALFAGMVVLGMAGAVGLQAQDRGFLLGMPRVSLTVKAGYHMPRAGGGSDIQSLWDLTREELTVESRDLAGMSIGGELGIRTTPRMDITVAVGYNASETRSEFRDWVDTDDLPIEQTTAFSTVPVTVGVKAYLWERGRSVGRFAWIPRTWNLYGAVAGGLVTYRFEQWGDFVDYETLDIFNERFYATERGATVHFAGGMDVNVNGRLVFTGEARYGIASAPIDSPDFTGFPDLDLNGLQITGGIGIRF